MLAFVKSLLDIHTHASTHQRNSTINTMLCSYHIKPHGTLQLMELHNKYTLTQHICLNQGVPDHYTSIIPRMGDLFKYVCNYPSTMFFIIIYSYSRKKLLAQICDISHPLISRNKLRYNSIQILLIYKHWHYERI